MGKRDLAFIIESSGRYTKPFPEEPTPPCCDTGYLLTDNGGYFLDNRIRKFQPSEEDIQLSLDVYSLHFPAEGGTRIINIQTNVIVQLIEVIPPSSNFTVIQDGYRLIVTAQENITPDTLESEIEVRVGSNRSFCKLTQDGVVYEYRLDLEAFPNNISAFGGTSKITALLKKYLNGILYNSEPVEPTYTGEAPGFLLRDDGTVEVENRGIDEGPERSISIHASYSSPESGVVEADVTVKQLENVVEEYSTPLISISYDSIPPSGGTVLPKTTVSQEARYSSNSTSQITSGGKWVFDGADNEDTGSVTRSTLGTVAIDTRVVAEISATLTLNGKSVTKDVQVTQLGNKLEDLRIGGNSDTQYTDPVTVWGPSGGTNTYTLWLRYTSGTYVASNFNDNGVEVVCLFDGEYTVTYRGDNSQFMDFKVWPRQTESDQRLNGTIDVVANIGDVQKEGHLDVYQKENPWVLASPWTVIIVEEPSGNIPYTGGTIRVVTEARRSIKLASGVWVTEKSGCEWSGYAEGFTYDSVAGTVTAEENLQSIGRRIAITASKDNGPNPTAYKLFHVYQDGNPTKPILKIKLPVIITEQPTEGMKVEIPDIGYTGSLAMGSVKSGLSEDGITIDFWLEYDTNELSNSAAWRMIQQYSGSSSKIVFSINLPFIKGIGDNYIMRFFRGHTTVALAYQAAMSDEYLCELDMSMN